MRRIIHFCAFLFLPLSILAQVDSLRHLPELEVNALRFGKNPTGLFVQESDSLISRLYLSSNLDQLLQAHSGVFVKNSGPSQLASPGFRGGSAAQTALIWSGFNLNHAMLGQVDLSLFPSFLVDKVQVQYGSQATLYGSGQVAGAIYLQNQKADSGFHADFFLGAASFGDYSQGIKASWAGPRFQVRQKIYHRIAANNFPYLNTLVFPAKTEEMRNARFQTKAWMQDLFVVPRLNHKLEFHSWIQTSARQIPAVLESNAAPSDQADNTLRLSADYQVQRNSWKWNFRTAFFRESLIYTAFRSNASESQSRQFIQALDQSVHFLNHRFVSGVQWNYSKGIVSSYLGGSALNQLAVFSSLESGWFHGKLKSQISLRKEFNSYSSVPLLPAIGLNWMLNKAWKLRGSWAMAYRIPTLNDLFWSPGGNPNLMPESSKNAELGLAYSTLKFNLALNIYHRRTENLIVWIPGSAYPEVANMHNAEAYGSELFWNANFGNKTFWIRLQGNHEFLRSINLSNSQDISFGKQLIYVPRVRHNTMLVGGYRNHSLSILSRYTGQRFTSSDNMYSLQDFLLFEISLASTLVLKSHSLKIDLACKNVLDTKYEIMLNRPMPGRSFQIQLFYSI